MLLNCDVREGSWESLGLQSVNPQGNQSWIFIGRTDAEAETPVLWPPDVKNWLIGKDPDAGKDWRQEEKEMTEDEMVGWHHWLNGHEFEQALGVGDEQGSLVCCSPWGRQESDTTEWLNWTEACTVHLPQLLEKRAHWPKVKNVRVKYSVDSLCTCCSGFFDILMECVPDLFNVLCSDKI